ncbi:MAG: hypothetical protein M0R06_22205 [Sphaerochaeta sp.]|jgi:hypothetical protein|nr:hypothetical protein [Sphaerochaeta sp.]
MSTIAVTAASIGLVHPTRAKTWPVKLAAAVTAGQVLYQTTSATFGLCDTDDAAKDQPAGIALEAGAAGQVISMVKEGAIYGVTLSGEAYGGLVYASGTAGGLSDSAKVQVIGRVMPLSDPSLTKVLYVEIPWGSADFS